MTRGPLFQDDYRPQLSGHETFPLRYGWLKKAYDRVAERPDAFRADDATVRFGVGKNMVSAIRFWSLAFKVTTDEDKGGLKTTAWGDAIFGDDGGLDPYLERPETLWILHWLLLSKPCRVPTWWVIMNQVSGTVVDAGDLLDAVQEIIRGNPRWDAPSPASIKRDTDVFLHTYTSRQDKLTIEEYIDCPFRNLGLARHLGDSVRFVFGPKTGLTPQVISFACADFAGGVGANDEISVAKLAVEPGGVGNAFKMNEGDLAAALEAACGGDGGGSRGMSVSRLNGEPRIVFEDGAGPAACHMLYAAYGPPTEKAGMATKGAIPL